MFTGSIVALITPMDKKGNICWLSVKKLIEYHINSATTAIVVAGTTGESATLSHEEHINLIITSIKFAKNRIPIIAGINTNTTTAAINLIKRLYNTGIVGFLIVTPYYNCPNQEGLFQYFKIIAENTNLPIILYNIPFRTGCDLLPKTVSRLAKINNIIGIKEATGDLSRIHQIKELIPDDFILLSGHDTTALDFIQLGGNGAISVTANVAAPNMATICKLAISGKYQKARAANRCLIPLHRALFIETNPIPIKWACKALGLSLTDTLRLPMTPITDYCRKVVASSLKDAGLL